MEEQAGKFLKNKEWSRAIDLYTKLLQSKPNNKQQIVSYLLGRSEGFLELGKHEAVVADCKTVMKLLADKNEDNNGNRARKRLVHALYAMKRFKEAEIATREWLAVLKMTNDIEVKELLENLLENFMNVNSKHGMDQLLRNLELKFTKNVTVKQPNELATCIYCNVSFREKSELRAHCQSEPHEMVIMSDDGHDWKWRPPPRGFQSDTYVLCENWKETSCCRFGNQCVEAHGLDELSEWKERFNYRQMKLQRAREKELYGRSYTEQLLEKWTQASNFNDVMKDSLEHVDVKCTSPLGATVSSKNSIYEWFFHITTKKSIKAVALLQDTHRNHFYIGQVVTQKEINKIKNNQEWLSPEQLNDGTLKEYRIQIVFTTSIFGTFRQSVVFDFGAEPVLVQHLCVDVVPDFDLDKINEIRREITLSLSERWSASNADIVKSALVHDTADVWEQRLLETYKCPHAGGFTLSHATMSDKKFTRNNYRETMHELLYMEEMARYDLIAKYNLTAKLQITHSYILSPNSTAASTAKYSCKGELFALVSLCKELSEDTLEGRLILMHCMSVLFCPSPVNRQEKCTVYEAHIEDKGKNVIYLRLSAETVERLNLQPEDTLEAQIQFQLNRIPYCEWHYTLDKMPSFKVIFPDTFLEPTIPWSPQRQWCNNLDKRLNLKQKEAIMAFTTPLHVRLPPLLVIGPFGTGKTFTLAQGIKELIKDSDNRILLCTHSNSAADLYIKEYFHHWVKDGNSNARPLRIYYRKRWVTTINPVVQQYCLINNNGTVRNIRMPTIEDIQKHQIIVVTLSTSVYLSAMGLPKGYFTHILLDEAAQAIECETITPLALATDETRIVLAGDHMQLGPDIFCNFVRSRGLHISLLERLYDHYPANFPCKVLLCENYRAHEAIIQFTSESFYDQKLVASSQQPSHGIFYPLTFFTTRGEDVQDQNSTAFYNNSEVYEVVERVIELKKNWPECWGDLNDQSIGVVTPYSDQVFRIRAELKKRRIDNVCVERVLNVQGKQFRVILISTVRTRKTCVTNTNSDVDYGFLSNLKLLNTAITRAQSLVAVVGDPVALCSVGKCSKVWERYIQVCRDNGSLFGITWTQLKCHLDGIELKKIYSLNPLAPEFIPRKYREMSENCATTVVDHMGPTALVASLPSTVAPILVSDCGTTVVDCVPQNTLLTPAVCPMIPQCHQITMPVHCKASQSLIHTMPQLHCPTVQTVCPQSVPPVVCAAPCLLPLQAAQSMSNCGTASPCAPPIHCQSVRTHTLPQPLQHGLSVASNYSPPLSNGQGLKSHCSTVISHGLPITHSTHIQNHPNSTTASSTNGIVPPCMPAYPIMPQDVGLVPVLYPQPLPMPLTRALPYNMQVPNGYPSAMRATTSNVGMDVQHGMLLNSQKPSNSLFVKGNPHTIGPVVRDTRPGNSQNKLIQFMNNVHLPEHHMLNECINLLPQDMTLADMLLQPTFIQERWYYHLRTTIGIEAAEKFKYLLHATSRKGELSSDSGLFDFNKPPLCDSPTFSWFDSPSNQINLNKPVYMRDESCPSVQQTNGLRSNPLYRRRASVDPLTASAAVAAQPIPISMNTDDVQKELNEQFANMCVGSSDYDTDVLLRTLCRTNFLPSDTINDGNCILDSPFQTYFS